MIKVTIRRDAVCAADDSIGPLELEIYLPEESTIQQLVQEIENLRFLQFSSSSTFITGFSDKTPLVCIQSSYYSKLPNEYFIDPYTQVKDCIRSGVLDFMFKNAR